MPMRKFGMKMNSIKYRKIYSFYMICIFLIITSFELSSTFILDDLPVNNTDTLFCNDDLRLMSFLQHPFNNSLLKNNPKFTSTSKFNESTQEVEDSSLNQTFSNLDVPPPRFDITAQYDVTIDKISPEAMEINATSMEFILNFTIESGEGSSYSVFRNLTLTNSSNPAETYKISTYESDWLHISSDAFSLKFILNNSFLTSLSLGDYYLSLYTDVYGTQSSDIISLPMKDLRVALVGPIQPIAEFNNKYGEDQFFNITIRITEFDGIALNNIQSFPEVLGENLKNQNPNMTLISESGDEINPVYFVRFVDNSSSNQGEFTFEVNFTADVATSENYPDGTHTLVISLTSNDGIVANVSTNIEAKGTVLLVRYKNIKIGTNNPFNYTDKTDNGNQHVDIRININESVLIDYEIIDNATGVLVDPPSKVAGRLIIFQDPNRADDEFALFQVTISGLANGTINLTANVLTPATGYDLKFYVRGHSAYQNTIPSNVTIYWDQLYYEYTYYDDQDDTGSSSSYNQKALGIDLDSWWVFQLAVFYASDNSPALTSQISYRFSNQAWSNLTDGNDGDLVDGIFFINYTHSIPEILSFECQVVNGSIFDPQGTLFVNKTAISKNFSLNVTWTYLKVDMIPVDHRLGTDSLTSINITANWAHDNAPFHNSILIGSDKWGNRRSLVFFNGSAIWSGLVQSETGTYGYSIVEVGQDLLYGITKFVNSTDGSSLVKVAIIWEEIYFTFSNVYNEEVSPSEQNFQAKLVFFANFNENATLYVYGNHTYDGIPFLGEALLYNFHDFEHPSILTFDSKGIAVWRGDFTEAEISVTFSVLQIISEVNYSVTTPGSWSEVTISWDKIVVTFESNLVYSHGTWVEINIGFRYLIQYKEEVNLSTVRYDLHSSNGTNWNTINWTHFRDFSIEPAVRWYNISTLYDSSTGLSGFVIRHIYTGTGIEEDGELVFAWIDDKAPSILELSTFDCGNGTILFIVDVTDNSEDWIGTGIGNVTLVDKRFDTDINFPQTPAHYELSSGIYRYIFAYNFNQSFPAYPTILQYDYNDPLIFSLSITDQGTSDFPSIFEAHRASNLLITKSFTYEAIYDNVTPRIISKEEKAFTIAYDDSLDGRVNITIYVRDELWSGLNESSVQLIIDKGTPPISVYDMTLMESITDSRSELFFNWIGDLIVFQTYEFTIIVTDIAGNTYKYTTKEPISIKDMAAPRIVLNTLELKPTNERQLEVSFAVEESGLGIDYVMVQIIYPYESLWFNLTFQGGTGGEGSSTTSIVTYSGILPIAINFNQFFGETRYAINIRIADKSRNEKYLNTAVENIYSDALKPLIFEPLVLISGAVILLIIVAIGIRATSRTEGYDIKRILVESEKISREAILTLMDEYALGVTVNFFDQVQGPVPVIWEPALLEDQEQVMLDLSDKSFSILEFVGLGEEERSGTFDFSTGSYECTALGYTFAIENPEARGGKENLTVVLLLRKEWGDHLLTFQDELLEKIREIRTLIENEQPSSSIEKKARQLREYVSRLMITLNQMYFNIDYKESLQVE